MTSVSYEHCPATFRSQSLLLRHLPIHAADRQRFKCDQCGALLASHAGLEFNINIEFMSENARNARFVAKWCGTVQWVHIEQRRIRTIDSSSVTSVSCHSGRGNTWSRITAPRNAGAAMRLLNESSANAAQKHFHRTTVKNASKVHNGQEIECDQCDYISTSSTEHRRHVVKHSTEKAYRCNECGAVFSRHEVLAKHTCCIHARKSEKCPGCN